MVEMKGKEHSEKANFLLITSLAILYFNSHPSMGDTFQDSLQITEIKARTKSPMYSAFFYTSTLMKNFNL